MSITTNENGILYTLQTITANENGTLYDLSKVYSNEGGILYEIHSETAIPQPMSGHFDSSAGSSGNGEPIGNTFRVSESTTVTSTFTNIKYGSTVGSLVFIFVIKNASDDSSYLTRSKSDGATSYTYINTLPAGEYYLALKVFSVYGTQSGVSSYCGSCDYNIAFA